MHRKILNFSWPGDFPADNASDFYFFILNLKSFTELHLYLVIKNIFTFEYL